MTLPMENPKLKIRRLARCIDTTYFKIIYKYP